MGREPGTKRRELRFGQRVHARGWCFELNLMATHGCEVELVPRDDLGRRPPREDTETKAAQQRRGTDVDPHNSKLAISPYELDVRDSRQSPSANVEDLRVKDVSREQEFVGGKLVLDWICRDRDLFRKGSNGRPRNPAAVAPDAHT
jgi:hypothetical protein